MRGRELSGAEVVADDRQGERRAVSEVGASVEVAHGVLRLQVEIRVGKGMRGVGQPGRVHAEALLTGWAGV